MESVYRKDQSFSYNFYRIMNTVPKRFYNEIQNFECCTQKPIRISNKEIGNLTIYHQSSSVS